MSKVTKKNKIGRQINAIQRIKETIKAIDENKFDITKTKRYRNNKSVSLASIKDRLQSELEALESRVT